MKVAIKQVNVHRAEGLTELVYKKSFDTLAKAQAKIDSQTWSFPDLGYDKHDIEIEWQNGESMVIRLDANHPSNEFWTPGRNNIAQSFVDQLKWYETDSGKKCGVSASDREEAKRMLRDLAFYDVGDKNLVVKVLPNRLPAYPRDQFLATYGRYNSESIALHRGGNEEQYPLHLYQDDQRSQGFSTHGEVKSALRIGDVQFTAVEVKS